MKNTLRKTIEHPLIDGKVDVGLSGATAIDYVIGLVEENIESQSKYVTLTKKWEKFTAAYNLFSLEDLYQDLQKEYPHHFGGKCRGIDITINLRKYRGGK